MSISTFLGLLSAGFILCRSPFASAGLLRGSGAANVSGTGTRSADNARSNHSIALQDGQAEKIYDNGTYGIDPCHRRPRLFVGIPSAPLAAERRLTVRHTWLKYKVVTELRCVQHRFFVGGHDMTPAARTLVKWENDQHGDIVQLPMKDAYDVLANKTLTIMEWVAANSHADWFMKLDDDSFPHLESIMRHLQEYGRPRYAYSGSFLWQHPVLHDGKWAEKADYKANFYPPYAVGAGYMLSHKLVKRFVREVYYNDTSRRDLLNNEDCQVGVWIDRMHDKHLVQLKDVKASMWGCQTGDLISMQLSIHVMKCMWRFKSTNFPIHDDHICCIGA